MLQLEPEKLQWFENLFNDVMRQVVRPDHLVVIMPASIGDFIANGVLAHALKEKYGKDIVLLVQERLQNFKVKFDGVKEIVYIPHEIMWRLQYYIRATEKYSGEGYIYGFFPYADDGSSDLYVTDKEMSILYNYRKTFGLSLKTPPIFQLLKTSLIQTKINFMKSIILKKKNLS